MDDNDLLFSVAPLIATSVITERAAPGKVWKRKLIHLRMIDKECGDRLVRIQVAASHRGASNRELETHNRSTGGTSLALLDSTPRSEMYSAVSTTTSELSQQSRPSAWPLSWSAQKFDCSRAGVPPISMRATDAAGTYRHSSLIAKLLQEASQLRVQPHLVSLQALTAVSGTCPTTSRRPRSLPAGGG